MTYLPILSTKCGRNNHPLGTVHRTNFLQRRPSGQPRIRAHLTQQPHPLSNRTGHMSPPLVIRESRRASTFLPAPGGIYKGRIFPPKENWQKQNNPQQTETDLYVVKSNLVSLSHLHNIYIFIAGKSLTTVEDPCLNSPLPRH